MKIAAAVSSLIFAALACSVSAQSPMALARRMAAECQKATLKKDFASMDKSTTPDFVYVDGKGRKTTKAQALAGMKGFYGALKIKSVKVKALSAKMAEGGHIYVQAMWTEGTMPMGGPKPSKFTGHSKDEVYSVKVKVKGKWLTKRVKNLSINDTIDGKPMPGM